LPGSSYITGDLVTAYTGVTADAGGKHHSTTIMGLTAFVSCTSTV
jgi:hypothetical protein